MSAIAPSWASSSPRLAIGQHSTQVHVTDVLAVWPILAVHLHRGLAHRRPRGMRRPSPPRCSNAPRRRARRPPTLRSWSSSSRLGRTRGLRPEMLDGLEAADRHTELLALLAYSTTPSSVPASRRRCRRLRQRDSSPANDRGAPARSYRSTRLAGRPGPGGAMSPPEQLEGTPPPADQPRRAVGAAETAGRRLQQSNATPRRHRAASPARSGAEPRRSESSRPPCLRTTPAVHREPEQLRGHHREPRYGTGANVAASSSTTSIAPRRRLRPGGHPPSEDCRAGRRRPAPATSRGRRCRGRAGWSRRGRRQRRGLLSMDCSSVSMRARLPDPSLDDFSQ
jgi:hypothetical protein